MQATEKVAAKTAVASASLRNAVLRDTSDEREPATMRKRIGSTTYVVSVRFSQTSRETMQDKILRLIESEVDESA